MKVEVEVKVRRRVNVSRKLIRLFENRSDYRDFQTRRVATRVQWTRGAALTYCYSPPEPQPYSRSRSTTRRHRSLPPLPPLSHRCRCLLRRLP